MATHNSTTILIQFVTTYKEYFFHAKTNYFCGRYAAVSVPYIINHSVAASASAPSQCHADNLIRGAGGHPKRLPSVSPRGE